MKKAKEVKEATKEKENLVGRLGHRGTFGFDCHGTKTNGSKR